jgi:gas vesicle structural protein
MSSAVAAPRQPQSMSQVQRMSKPSGLAEVLDVLLDKGLVVDVYVRVALVGIELLTIDIRIVIASVDTYLRFAEAVNRLDLTEVDEAKGLPDLFGDMEEDGAGRKTKGVLEGAKEALFGGGDDDDDDDSSSSRRSSSSKRSSSGQRSSAGQRTSAKKSSSSSNGRSRSRSRSTKSGSRGR